MVRVQRRQGLRHRGRVTRRGRCQHASHAINAINAMLDGPQPAGGSGWGGEREGGK